MVKGSDGLHRRACGPISDRRFVSVAGSDRKIQLRQTIGSILCRSDDDQFFIYSALKSGPNTNIITRDTLQNHAHLFDEQLRTVFRRWQQQHQYSVKNVEDPDIVEFDDRIEFDMNAQQMDDGCWHIPFRSNSSFTFQDDNFFKLWKNWLCVSKE